MLQVRRRKCTRFRCVMSWEGFSHRAVADHAMCHFFRLRMLIYRSPKASKTTIEFSSRCPSNPEKSLQASFNILLRDRTMRKVFFIPMLATALTSFAQSSLNVDWEWKEDHKCSATSPGLLVSGIPSGTKLLQVELVDHDARHLNHGGGSVVLDGSDSVTVPEGALKNYRGPCPPNFSSFGHDYEFTVKAIAADGQTELARGRKTKTFSASSVK
jgi:phosphatidylethanolamine-binding protein (PEBP) family uncharacterized protein